MVRTSSVSTVDRLVQVVECFSGENPTWSLAELSASLDLPKSTLHRFLISLETHGILRRDPADRLWRLGYRLVTWGKLAEKSTGLNDVARPIMRQIAAETGETVALTVYEGHEVVCIEKIDTRHSVRLAFEVGGRRPPHAGASSKVLMAYLSQEEIRAIIRDQGLPKLCANTISDPEELAADLARIRELGYALSVEETDPGAWGIATPIWDRSGQVIGAIGVAGPVMRFSDDLAQQYVAVCRRASQEIAELMGGGDRAAAQRG
jgi:IclR family KDG regulon transcriptional repressor